MSGKMDALAQAILKTPGIDDADLSEIKSLVRRFPYFAPSQYLLLAKLKRAQSPEYETQASKTILYFDNPFGFQVFMEPEQYEAQHTLPKHEIQPLPTIASEEDFSASTADPVKFEDAVIAATNQTDAVVSPDEDKTAGSIFITEEASAHESKVPDETQTKDPAVAVLSDTESVREDIEPTTAQDTPHESATAGAQDPTEKASSVASTDASDFTFEPYHTVDYFASQGIKLTQDAQPQDKFGKQLKSFTEWLKTMKKIPAGAVGVQSSSEKKVANLAEDSVHNPDVVTEAMAEVWLKQGNKEKAIDTYRKLSLQNPSKSAYFAGLIENLKSSS